MKAIGIDPGINGGIAFLQDTTCIAVIPTPTKTYTVGTGKKQKKKKTVDEAEIGKLFRSFNPDVIYIEKVGAMPGQGVTSMFNFGFVTGIMYGIAGGIGCPIFDTRPQEWKNIILDGTEKDKQAAIDFCYDNFPGIDLKATKRSKKDHDGMADAVCVAVYGIREETIKRNGGGDDI